MEAGNAKADNSKAGNAMAADRKVDDDDPLAGDDLLSADHVAAIRSLAERQGLSADALLDTARAFKRRELDANGGADDNAVMVDPSKSNAPPSLSVRTVIQQVRMRHHVPLSVAEYSEEDWALIAPHFPSRSRTIPRKQMLEACVRFAVGHAISKSAADCSVSSFLSYEVSRYGGARMKALADAMEGVLSPHRCVELRALVAYLEERAANRARWQTMNN